MALTTIAKVKTLLGITDSSQDAVLQALVDSMSAYIENYCGRTFTKPGTAIAELVNGNGTYSIFVKNLPIDTITKIEERVDKTTWEEIDSEDYEQDDETGEIRFNFLTEEGLKNYKVTYKGGYATIPLDLDMATQQMVVTEFNTRGAGGEVSSERLGDYSVTYEVGAADSDKFVDNVLDKYKIINV